MVVAGGARLNVLYACERGTVSSMPASSASGPSCCSRRCCIVTTRSTSRVPWTAFRQRCAFSPVAHRRAARTSPSAGIGSSPTRCNVSVTGSSPYVRLRSAATDAARAHLARLDAAPRVLLPARQLAVGCCLPALIGVLLATLFGRSLTPAGATGLHVLVDRRCGRYAATRSASGHASGAGIAKTWVRRARERRAVEDHDDESSPMAATSLPSGRSRCLGAGARTSADLCHRTQGRATCSHHRPHHARSLDVGPATRTGTVRHRPRRPGHHRRRRTRGRHRRSPRWRDRRHHSAASRGAAELLSKRLRTSC